MGTARATAFSANSVLKREAIRPIDTLRKALQHGPLQQFLADVHSSGGGSGDPELGDLFVGVELEAVNQAELLHHAHGDGREDSEIRHERGKAAESKARTLGTGHLHGSANGLLGNRIQLGHGHREQSLVGRCRTPCAMRRCMRYSSGCTRTLSIGAGERSLESILQAPGEPGIVLCEVSHRTPVYSDAARRKRCA